MIVAVMEASRAISPSFSIMAIEKMKMLSAGALLVRGMGRAMIMAKRRIRVAINCWFRNRGNLGLIRCSMGVKIFVMKEIINFPVLGVNSLCNIFGGR